MGTHARLAREFFYLNMGKSASKGGSTSHSYIHYECFQ